MLELGGRRTDATVLINLYEYRQKIEIEGSGHGA